MTLRLLDVPSQRFKSTTLSEVNLDAAKTTVWIDLMSPSRDEMRSVGQRFNFHPLAIEDAQKRRQRPKTDFYANHVFVVFYALEPEPEGSDVTAQEIGLFATDNLVVTVRTVEIEEINTATHRWAEHCTKEQENHSAMLVYTIVDAVVDGYFPCMDRIAEEIDALEYRLFDGDQTDNLQSIFRLKRSLLDLRRVIAPSRDVFNSFTRWEMPALGDDSVFYFQDVYDHVIRITDQIDADREVLASAIDVHLSLVSNRMNQTVRTLTAASIVLMSLALIAGIYGMNFDNIPELGWHYGYFGALALMVIVGGSLAFLFRRLDWW